MVGGIVLTAILVPVGMGYAEAAGLEPIYGLYATIGALVVYALLGPSRTLVLGPDSSLAPIIAATIVPLAADPANAATLAAGLAVLSGGLCLAAGVVRAGFVTELLATPIRYGYLNGIALTIIVGQLPKLFGFSVDAEGLIDEAVAFADGLRAGLTNPVALAVGVAALAFIVAAGRVVPRLPAILVAVVVGTIVSAVAGLATVAVGPVVGALPPGLPRPSIPSIPIDDIQPLLAGAIAIALVSMADTSVLSRTLASRRGERSECERRVDGPRCGKSRVSRAVGLRRECQRVAHLGRNVVRRSHSIGRARRCRAHRPATRLRAGAPQRTCPPRCSPPSSLPRACRSSRSTVWSASTGCADPSSSCRSRASLPSLLVGVVAGIFISVGIAIVAFLWRAWRPYSAILGRLPGVKGYHDTSRHPEADLVPGLVLFRWDAPLFFANAEMFRDAVEDAIESSPTPVRRVVIAAEPVTDIDATAAADVLSELHDALVAADIELAIAELKGPAKDRLRHYGLYDRIGETRFHPTVGEAVERLRRRERRAVGQFGGSRRTVTVQPPGTSCRCGSCTMTRSPPSARGVRVMVPWCASVMLLTIARPRPTPAWPSRIRPEPR